MLRPQYIADGGGVLYQGIEVKLGIGGILALVFMILKLTGNIHWSWVWVLAPFWIPMVLSWMFYVVAIVLGSKD